jgi:arsenate reductase
MARATLWSMTGQYTKPSRNTGSGKQQAGGWLLSGGGESLVAANRKIYNVLFLCTGNSARSILAESILNRLGKGRFRGYSAGSHPKGEVHPLAVRLLKSVGMRVDGLRSKRWDEFSRPGAPKMDFVVTVCDHAAGEACPLWPGKPVRLHWGVPDPAAVDGDASTREDAFRIAYRRLENHIQEFIRELLRGRTGGRMIGPVP